MGRWEGRGSNYCIVGAAFLAAAGGRCYYEVEVLEAEGSLLVGFAGTNLGLCMKMGEDACSWGFYAGDGDGYHR
jgi:hypothetical protein